MSAPGYSLKDSIKQLPRNIAQSVARAEAATAEQRRAAAVFGNVFLHVHPVRVHTNTLRAGYTLGLGLAAFYLFLILVVTGILAMFYYTPSTQLAYRSMKDLEYAVSFGVVLRNMHRWSAHGMVAIVFLHMCRVFYTGAFKAPREFNWVVGVSLLLVTLFLSFTGYLLPWDQLAYWAVTVGSNIVAYMPWLGEKVRFVLLGGNEVGQMALLRFYALHIAVLPLAAIALLSVHFWRIRKDGGLSRPPGGASPASARGAAEIGAGSPETTYSLMAIVEGEPMAVERVPEETVQAWPHLMLRELLVFLLVLIAVLGVSLVFNAPLEEPANALHSPNPAKAPWYFVGIQELVSYSALLGGIVVPTLIVLGLLLLPYLDRAPRGTGVWFSPDRRLSTVVFTVFVAAMVTLILIGQLMRGPNWSFHWPWL
ncbi:MAG: cytochrome b N-terminal domain-containing protein [Anaeromyxobacteraceae bacterium]